MSAFILETEGLVREFSGFVAVDNVNLRIREGAICAIIGPNGAGKTTCFNLLTKFLQPTRGRIRYRGNDITDLEPADVARLGLGRSFQISAVFPRADVAAECADGAAAPPRRIAGFLAPESALEVYDERAEQAAAGRRPCVLCRHPGGRAAIWPQACAGDRDNPRALILNCCCLTSRPPA